MTFFYPSKGEQSNYWLKNPCCRKLIMRISITSLMISICAIAFATNSTNGQVLEKVVRIGMHNEPLNDLFRKLRQESISLVLPGKLSEYPNITIEEDNRTVRQLLELALKDTNLGFKTQETALIIFFKNNQQSLDTNDPVPIETPGPMDVKGVVTTTSGVPLAGVNIVVKGTTRGTTSDSNGSYVVDALGNEILVFSFIGYKTLEVAIVGRTEINTILEEDIATLTEVEINAGYWKVNKDAGTGNISRVAADDIAKQPVSNPLMAAAGRVPGVFISQGTGVPGGNMSIQIRGRGSIASGTYPLYVVDGVPFPSAPIGTEASGQITGSGNPLNNINPNDIESIEFLKDADATAIYGSRGANGVVLITTKKGSSSKQMSIDLNVYQGVGQATRKMDLLSRQQYLDMRRAAFRNDGETPGSSTTDYDLIKWDTTRYTDWQKNLIGGTASITSAQATLTAGNANFQCLFSGRYYRETTVFPGNLADQKFSGRFSLSYKSNDGKFNATFSGSYLIDRNKLMGEDLTYYALSLPPVAPALYDSIGQINWEKNTWDNPIAGLQREFDSRTGTLVSNGVLSYELAKGLTIKANLGYTDIRVDETVISPLSSFNPASGYPSGLTSFGNNTVRTSIAEPQLGYVTKIGLGILSTLVGTTFQQTISDQNFFNATGFASDAQLRNIMAAGSITPTVANNTTYRYGAGFARINYNWQEKYIINLTGRRDGSSRFGPANRFSNFGAAGAAWVFSREGFMQGVPVISFGKLRASYGTTGNDQIGDYAFLDLWNSSLYPYEGKKGIYPRSLFNAEYGWEVNKKFETGFDIGLGNNRVMVGMAYYKNSSSNQLVGYDLPSTTGFQSIQQNLNAQIENTGLEFEVSSLNVSRSNFTWSTSANLTIPKNKLVSYPNINASSYRYTYMVGEPLSIQYKYAATGVDPQTGLYTFKDINGDGSTSFPDDLQTYKKIAQEFYGGISNTVTFKGFSVDFFFQFVKQTGWNYLRGFEVPGSMSNQPAFVMNNWRKEGDHSSIQRFTQGYGAARTAYSNAASSSDLSISDASFIRLKNVSISYSLPKSFLNKNRIENARIYLQGQNLLTITNYQGLDPETQTISRLPPLRMITLGFQLTF